MMIMCIHTWWVRTRSSTGSPVSASRTVTVSVVGSPGRTSAGTSRLTSRPASCGLTGGTSVSSITLISGRIGMPIPSDQASTPFMPRSAWSVRLSQVKPAPSASASVGDAGEVGRLADAGAQRRVQDLVRRWPAAGSGAAAARW